MTGLVDYNQVHVNLFDAQRAVNGTKIKIWRTAGKFEVSMLLTDEAEPQPLESLGTKHSTYQTWRFGD